MKTIDQSSNTDEVIADLDIYVRHYHATTHATTKETGFRTQEQTSNTLSSAARRLYDLGILSSLEDAQLTPQGFEIARQVYQSLASHAAK